MVWRQVLTEVFLTQLTPSQTRLLAAARIGHLATADEAGAPHVIPVCFALGADLIYGDVIYSVLDQKPKRTSLNRLRRVRNILANPQVSLVVDHYEEAWDRLWYILVRGRAELLVNSRQPRWCPWVADCFAVGTTLRFVRNATQYFHFYHFTIIYGGVYTPSVGGFPYPTGWIFIPEWVDFHTSDVAHIIQPPAMRGL